MASIGATSLLVESHILQTVKFVPMPSNTQLLPKDYTELVNLTDIEGEVKQQDKMDGAEERFRTTSEFLRKHISFIEDYSGGWLSENSSTLNRMDDKRLRLLR